MEEFPNLPQEIKVQSFNGPEPQYEYAESKFSQVFMSLLKEWAKTLHEMSEEDVRKLKTIDTIKYFDQLESEGWQLYELARDLQGVYEYRRFRRLKNVQ
jgi:hypothetical protein